MFFFPHQKIIIIFRGLLVVLLFLVVIIIPITSYRAVILITPQQETIKKEIVAPLTLEKIKQDSNINQYLFEETISQSKDFIVPGSKEIEQPATGTATLINDYFRDQTLVKTTRLLSTDGVLFRLSQRVTIPANQQVQVQIYADKPGKQGEIGPTTFTVPGLWEGLQNKIYAVSEEPTSGGLVQVGVVKQKNIDDAKKQLEDKILQMAQENIPQKNLKQQNLDGLAIRKTIKEFSCSAKAGDEVGKFTMTIEIRVLLVAFNRQEIFNLALNNLKEQIPTDKDLLSVDSQNWQTSIYYFDADNKKASLKVYLTGQLIINTEHSTLDKLSLFNLTKQSAQVYLENYPEIEQAKIKLYPFFIKKIPQQLSRIIYKISI